MKHAVYPAIALALLSSACAQSTAPAPQVAASVGSSNGTPMTSPTPTMAAEYVAMAGASDLWEIESSRALLAKSRQPEVRQFAEMMIDHHSKSAAKVKAAASAARIVVGDPTLDAEQRHMLAEIQAATPAGIDAVYIAHQRSAHDMALALHARYADGGDMAGLRTAAREIVPVVQAHRIQLDRLGAAEGAHASH